ncbi:hypothetical protein N9Y89_00610 [bacterium]|nr:hypothetical protein [bacterium]
MGDNTINFQRPWKRYTMYEAIKHFTVDNEYFLLLRRYGVIGCALVIYFLFSFIFVFLKQKRKIDTLDSKTKSISYTTLLTLGGLGISRIAVLPTMGGRVGIYGLGLSI